MLNATLHLEYQCFPFCLCFSEHLSSLELLRWEGKRRGGQVRWLNEWFIWSNKYLELHCLWPLESKINSVERTGTQPQHQRSSQPDNNFKAAATILAHTHPHRQTTTEKLAMEWNIKTTKKNELNDSLMSFSTLWHKLSPQRFLVTPNWDFKSHVVLCKAEMTESDTLGNKLLYHPWPVAYWPPAAPNCRTPPKANTI